jgi:hypothetical protein
MKFISLGACCETTFVIQSHLNSYIKYPFDWMSISNIDDIIDVLDSDFKNFITVTENFHSCTSRISTYNIANAHNIPQDAIDRRIQRFRSLKNMTDEEIIFILKTHLTKENPITMSGVEIKDAIRLRNSLCNYTNNFRLLIVNEVENIDTDHIDSIRYQNITIQKLKGVKRDDFQRISYCDYMNKAPLEIRNKWSDIIKYNLLK